MQERNQKDSYKEQIRVLVNHLNGVAAIVVGAASGMSAAAGFRHYYERDQDFIEHFSRYEEKYGYHNTFDGFYYRYRSSEERWAFIAGLLCMILDAQTGQPYEDLFEILRDKNYYILTTNQDTQFTRVFPEEKSALSRVTGGIFSAAADATTGFTILRNAARKWSRGYVHGCFWRAENTGRNTAD
mgnify:CR=1 FL=1